MKKPGKGRFTTFIAALVAFALVSAGFAVVREHAVPYKAKAARQMSDEEALYLKIARTAFHDNRSIDNLFAYKSHRPGLSVLVAPATFSKVRARWWAYFIVAQCATLLMAIIIWSSARAGHSIWKSALLAVLFTVTPPGFFYMNQAFPDIITGMMLALGFVFLLNPTPARTTCAVLMALIAPWFTDAAVIPAALLGMGALVYAPDKRTLVIAGAMIFAGGFALSQYYYHLYATPYPVGYIQAISKAANNPLGQLAMTLLDGAHGVLILAPALIFAPVAYIRWIRIDHRRILPVLSALALISSLFISAPGAHWFGGAAPVGRHGVLFLWLTFPAFIVWIDAGLSARQKVMALPLMIFSIFEIVVLYNHFPWWFSKANPLLNIDWLGWLAPMAPNLTKGYAEQELVMAAGWAGLFFVYVLISTPLISFHRGKSGAFESEY